MDDGKTFWSTNIASEPLKSLSNKQVNSKVSQNTRFKESSLRPNPIDLATENSFLALITQKYSVASNFESFKSFLKNRYCKEGHSSLGGERSVKSYLILSEYYTSIEHEGVLDIERPIIKNNVITAKPDMLIVNGHTKAIEIEPKVPQWYEVKHKTDRLKANGADEVIIAIAYNPDNSERTMKQIEGKKLLEYCDGIILVDFTKFDDLLKGEINATELVKLYREERYDNQQLYCVLPPLSRKNRSHLT